MVAETVYYDLLGIAPSATPTEIKKAFRKASLEHHPDKNPDDQEAASIRFQEISAAYEVLSDDDARAAYDRYGAEGMKGGGGASAADMDDIFASMFGGMGGMGGMGGGFGFDFDADDRGAPPPPRRSKDSVVRYEVTLEDLYCGRTAHLKLSRDVICGQCRGSGAKDNAKPQACVSCGGKGQVVEMTAAGGGFLQQRVTMCGACHGKGKKYREKDQCKKCKGAQIQKEKTSIDVNITKGMRPAQKITFAAMADEVPGAKTGDLILQLDAKEHPTFEMDGLDLLVHVQLSLSEALLGFDRVVLQHLDGRLLKVAKPSGHITTPGAVDKITGQGMPGHRGSTYGDLYLHWDVHFPPEGTIFDEATAAAVRNLSPPLPGIKPSNPDTVVDEEIVVPTTMEQFGSNKGPEESEWQEGESDAGSGCVVM